MKKLVILAAVLFATTAWAKTFDGCGVRFSYPATWTARANPHDQIFLWQLTNVTCAIGLRPPGWRKRNEASAVDLGSWAVTIVVTDRPLSEVARNAGFAKSEELANTDGSSPGALEPGGWAIDSLGIAPARHFHTACCEALRGSTVSRGEAKDGTKASFSSDVALLSRKRRSAIFNTAIDEEFSDVLTEALKSFRFLP